MGSVVSICDHQAQLVLNQCLSNFHVPVTHLEIVRCRFRHTWPGVGPESLPFPSAPGSAMLLVPGPGLSRKGLKSPSLSQRRTPKPRQGKQFTPNHKAHTSSLPTPIATFSGSTPRVPHHLLRENDILRKRPEKSCPGVHLSQ